MSENFVQPLAIGFQSNQKMQGRESERKSSNQQFHMAMRNSKDRSCKANLEHFLESNSYMLYIRSSGSQESNASNGVQIGVEMKKLWPFEDNCTKLAYKFNLWILNPLQNDTNFEFTHYHFDVSPSLRWELHLGHCIHPKWTPHD